MLEIEYFDNLVHYCFKKYDISDLLQSICGVTNDVIQKGSENFKIWLMMTIVYF